MLAASHGRVSETYLSEFEEDLFQRKGLTCEVRLVPSEPRWSCSNLSGAAR